MQRGTWLAGLAGVFAVGMAVGRSRLWLPPIVGLFFDEPDVARLLPVPQSVPGFTVPDTNGANDFHIQDVQAPGLVEGSVAVIFYRATVTGSGSFHVRVNSPQPLEHTFSASGSSSWQEVIPAGVLKAANNELVFAVTGGRVAFSNVTILYKSNQLTIKGSIVVGSIGQ
jgi:hypothetical protein